MRNISVIPIKDINVQKKKEKLSIKAIIGPLKVEKLHVIAKKGGISFHAHKFDNFRFRPRRLKVFGECYSWMSDYVDCGHKLCHRVTIIDPLHRRIRKKNTTNSWRFDRELYFKNKYK